MRRRAPTFLLRTEILRTAAHVHDQCIAIEAQRLVRVTHHDRRVIDTRKQALRLDVPARITLVLGEGEYLQVIAVRVREVEGIDNPGTRVPIRPALR